MRVLWWELFATWLSDRGRLHSHRNHSNAGESPTGASLVALRKHQTYFWNHRGSVQTRLRLQSHAFVFLFSFYFFLPLPVFWLILSSSSPPSFLSRSPPNLCPSLCLPPCLPSFFCLCLLAFPRLHLSVHLSRRFSSPSSFLPALAEMCSVIFCLFSSLSCSVIRLYNLAPDCLVFEMRTETEMTRLDLSLFLSPSLHASPFLSLCYLSFSIYSSLSSSPSPSCLFFSFLSLVPIYICCHPSLSLYPSSDSVSLPLLFFSQLRLSVCLSLPGCFCLSPSPPSVPPPVAVSSAQCCRYPWRCRRASRWTCWGGGRLLHTSATSLWTRRAAQCSAVILSMSLARSVLLCTSA